MAIYIYSRGNTKDHYWVEITSSGYREVKTPEAISFIKSCGDLNLDDLRCFLGRHENKLVLFINVISDRKDSQDRWISNRLLIEEDTAIDEAKLRSFAILTIPSIILDSSDTKKIEDMLNRNLEIIDKLNQAIKSSADGGFTVDPEIINQFIAEVNLKLEFEPPEKEIKLDQILDSSEETKEKLAEDLKKYRLPKEEERALVVVTKNLSGKTLHDHKVWRGLSNLNILNNLNVDNSVSSFRKNQTLFLFLVIFFFLFIVFGI